MVSLLSKALGRRPIRDEIGRCPGCGHPITRADDSVRLRADWYAHTRCATYNVRRMNALGRDRAGRPLGSARPALPPVGTD